MPSTGRAQTGGAVLAMTVERPGAPLVARERLAPEPGEGELLVRVLACGVCRTDLHVADGDLPSLGRPVVPGHEIVGEVVRAGPGVSGIAPGTRVGIPWLGWTCGACEMCRAGRENLCRSARFTGYHRDGGFAELAVADARYAFPLPPEGDPVGAAPLLCAGLIGYRAWRMAGDARRLGIYGFGAAGHLVAQLARFHGQDVFAFTRPGDVQGERFARSLGAAWAGPSDAQPPAPLDAAILFAPVGALVPAALRAVGPGATVVCAGIHMTDIPSFPYALLWEERVLRSVANLTRADGEALLELAGRIPLRCTVTPFPLREANRALDALRSGALDGAAVLVP
jgi:propanol-preferring alcohol dehydrogenase